MNDWILVVLAVAFCLYQRWAYLQTLQLWKQVQKQEEEFDKAQGDRLAKMRARGRRTNGRIL